jgi:hypothetical protein
MAKRRDTINPVQYQIMLNYITNFIYENEVILRKKNIKSLSQRK